MTTEQKPGDPADKGLDTFVSHRAGYGDDRLEKLIEYLRRQPRATLASGEGALLLAEIDRLRARCRQIDDEAYDYAEQIEQLKAAAKDSADHYADARAEIDRLRDDLHTQDGWVQWANGEMEWLRQRAERAERILAALREPSVNIWEAAVFALDADEDMNIAIRAAVAAAEQEVGRE